MERVAVIMAGGKGERLWPMSRRNRPKQFLSLCGENETLIASTVNRMRKLTDIKNIFIVTGKDYKDITESQIPGLPKENIICEPMGKNTTACIGYACQIIRKKYGDAIAMVVPSDHFIKDEEAFASDLNKCCAIAEAQKTIVTVGITPTKPETGFGYINVNKNAPVEGVELAWKMKKFVEKPEYKVAKRYVASDRYLWNAGMFVFPTSYMLKCLKRFHPHNAICLANIGKYIGKKNEELITYQMFDRMDSISIDYSVMEHVRGSVTVQATFDWNDVGTWAAIPEIQDQDDNGNYVLTGKVASYESERNVVVSTEGKAVALLGVNDLVVIDSGNAVLVCHKDYAQKIKEATKQLIDNPEYL